RRGQGDGNAEISHVGCRRGRAVGDVAGARPAGPLRRLSQSSGKDRRQRAGRRRRRYRDENFRRRAAASSGPAVRGREPRRRRRSGLETRGGAGGNLGAEGVYPADPDGYTLLASQPAPITSNVALYKKLNFDPAALESVAVMSKFPNVLLVRQDFPAKTAQEFIAYAKANPDKITFASQGPGTSSHLNAELFMKLTGTQMVHV